MRNNEKKCEIFSIILHFYEEILANNHLIRGNFYQKQIFFIKTLIFISFQMKYFGKKINCKFKLIFVKSIQSFQKN